MYALHCAGQSYVGLYMYVYKLNNRTTSLFNRIRIRTIYTTHDASA